MTEFLKTTTANKGANMGKLIKDPNMANPVTSTSKCGQALGACGAIAGYQSITGNTGSSALDGDGPTVWDGKEWPVPMKPYVASASPGAQGGSVPDMDAILNARAVMPSYLVNPDATDAKCNTETGENCSAAVIAAFRGPVF